MHKTKTDSVFGTLREAIVSGALAPGDWIRPQDWSQRLKVSAIPVREALRRLEANGLVEIDPHRGARVATQSEAHVAETYLIRMALEGLAAREGIRRLDDGGFQQLLSLVERKTAELLEALKAGDGAKIRSANEEIHMSIYKASGLTRLVSMIESLWATYPFRTLTWRPERRGQIAEEHTHLLEILRERDPDRLAEATARHILLSQETLAFWAKETSDAASLAITMTA